MNDTDERLIPKMPGPPGYSAALEAVGGTAAPLLAGFAFTLIGLVVTRSQALAQPNLALVLLVVAALLLINTVQFAFRARQHYLPPGDYLGLLEIARRDGIDADSIRHSYGTSLLEHKRLLGYLRVSYNTGIFFLLAGVAVVLIPLGRLADASVLRLTAVILVAVGAIVEVIFALKPAVMDALPRRLALATLTAVIVTSALTLGLTLAVRLADLRGPRGYRGPQGAQGASGRNGATGREGRPGPTGKEGPRGPRGYPAQPSPQPGS